MEEQVEDMRIIFCSLPEDDAKQFARELVKNRLVACVQVFPSVTSVYWWEGKVCEEQESVLLCKTSQSCVSALTLFIKEHHPYDVPEIVSVPVQKREGNMDYFSWLTEVLQKG